MKAIFIICLLGLALANVLTLTDGNFEETISQNKLVLVNFFNSSCESCEGFTAEFAKLKEAIKEYKSITLAELDAAVYRKIAEKYEVHECPVIIFFANKSPSFYSDSYKAEEMLSYAKKILKSFTDAEAMLNNAGEDAKWTSMRSSEGYVISFDLPQSLNVMHNRGKVILLFMTPKDERANDTFWKLAASKSSSDLIFARFVKKNEDWSRKLTKYFRIRDEDIPRIEIVDFASVKDVDKDRPRRFLFEGKVEVDSLEKFMDDYKRGKLTEFAEPEPEPEPEYVKEVVSDTFKAEVINNDLDVLVNFYTDQCLHCKIFAPTYKAVAEALKDSKKLKVVEINGATNKVAGMFVSSYPSIYIYPAGKKDHPIPFLDEIKSKKTVIEFVKRHCTHVVYEMKEDL
eukprot:TRINITY_DN17024_c0_g1_i3.p1 TRINITY_DN17024_c0_g1~~TRINITY_DN17024_c0_g1_i3.p1  ORF type:complete len:400 (+),score=79.64 TRINITY_DN17024_c0_g1_i3:152-1351(+)